MMGLNMREKKAVSREVAKRYKKGRKEEKRYDGKVFKALRKTWYICGRRVVPYLKER